MPPKKLSVFLGGIFLLYFVPVMADYLTRLVTVRVPSAWVVRSM